MERSSPRPSESPTWKGANAVVNDAHIPTELITDRRAAHDRRKTPRRQEAAAAAPAAEERRTSSRRKVERRRQIDPTTCERDYNEEQVTFMKAMDDYKRRSGRMFPTWSEVLEVLVSLGYRKVEAPTDVFKKANG